VDVVALDAGALIPAEFLSANYDSVVLRTRAAHRLTDPAINPDFWFSFGDAHFWKHDAERKPQPTEWEESGSTS